MSKKNRKHRKEGMTKGIDHMIVCPVCKAYSYPMQFSEPQNEIEKEAVICGSCKTDLKPYITAMEAWEKEQAEKKLKEGETITTTSAGPIAPEIVNVVDGVVVEKPKRKSSPRKKKTEEPTSSTTTN